MIPDPPQGGRSAECTAGIGSWDRALRLATDAPDALEALTGILEEAGRDTGARAGAILDVDGSLRAVWGWQREEWQALLDGGVRDALLAGRDIPSHANLVAAALRFRNVASGYAVFGFSPGSEVPPARKWLIERYAGLCALVLENDRLFDEARHARQARDHFLTAIHHELRTPATAIMLKTGMLRSGLLGSLPPALQKTVGTLETDVSELIRVAGNVLDLAWLEAGVAPDRSDLLDVRATILEILRQIEPIADRKGLTLSVFIPRGLPPMQTDARRFRRILLHLASNAVKYTDEGRIEVRVEHTARGERRRRERLLIIRVTDAGRGIPPEEMERVFEPFTQVDEGARSDSASRGVGLGLPLARKLARSLGGEVRVQHREGGGTIATLQLPYNAPHSG